jgi:SAM-dependent methyltransferase
MASMTQGLFKWLRGSQPSAAQAPLMDASLAAVPQTRHSTGLGELMKVISGAEGLNILDLGSTSPQNIMRLTGMGHRVANEDVLLASLDNSVVSKDEKGNVIVNVDAFLCANLQYHEGQFDAILCWDVPDYLPEPLVKPMFERLHSSLKPGGHLLAFFHVEGQSSETAYYRYHIAGKDELDRKRGPQYPLQRIFHNRHIEKLFKGYGGLKFFLARDHVREVLVTR